ncbi:MAG: MFS transporter [Deltaproteobacteria bacterium]|nr:MFS transporter [Deltaproteobacteria bacterium]
MSVPVRGIKALPMAWIVLAAAFSMQMAFSGIHFSFGVFLKPVAEEFQWSRGATAFAYTLLWWVSSAAAVFFGMLADRIGARKVLVFGGIVFGLGIFLSSRVQNLWEFYLYFGVLAGIGRAADRAPLLSAVFQFFNKRKGLAAGITLSGTGIGTLFFPWLARYVMSVVDWRAAFAVMGLISWLILLPAAFIIRKPKPGEAEPGNNSAKPEVEHAESSGILGTPDKEWTVQEVLKNRVFWIFVVTGLACCISHSLPLAHIVAYASDRGIPDLSSATVLGVIGVSAAMGRLLWGAISDQIGGRKTVLCCIFLQTMAMFLVAFAKSLGAFYLFAVGFGLAYGGVLPLYAVVTRELFGMRRFGTIYGLHSVATGGGMGAGGIVGGYLFDFSGSYFLPFMTSTALGLFAVGFAAHLAFLKGPGISSQEKSLEVRVATVDA